MKWIVSQLGRREDYAPARAFHAHGELAKLFTDCWVPQGHAMLSHMPREIRDLQNRYHEGIPSRLVSAFTWRFCALSARRRLLGGPPKVDRYGLIDELQVTLDQLVAQLMSRNGACGRADAFFGFCSECEASLDVAKHLGLLTVVDQFDPGLSDYEAMRIEYNTWAGWQEGPFGVPEKRLARSRDSWAKADAILVNSTYSRECITAQGADPNKVMVVPLAWERAIHERRRPAADESDALRVLWVGRVTLQKGIQYLWQAARVLQDENVQFTVAGDIGITADAVRGFPPNTVFLGKVDRKAKELLYEQSDVFVLPTISEGFGITQLEAMSVGLPVIVTRCCGDVVTDGQDGFLVPVRDGATLASRILQLHRDRNLLRDMSSRTTAKCARFSLESYRQGILRGLALLGLSDSTEALHQ